MRRSAARIVREYGPFPGVDAVHGVTYDGRYVWVATGEAIRSLDPVSGRMIGSIDVAANAGTAFDGRHLYQIAGDRIQRIDPATGRVLDTVPVPGGGGASGLAWGEGSLWVGRHGDRTIHEIDPLTGGILRTITSDRFVTGVSWVNGQLWHGTWEKDVSDVRRVDPATGEVLELLDLPPGVAVSGLESDGRGLFFCGGGTSARVRAIQRPRAGAEISDETALLNVDLDITSGHDLTPLAGALRSRLVVLHVGRVRRTWSARFELRTQPPNADAAIRRFVSAIDTLRAGPRSLWRRARMRDFNIGIQAGLRPHAVELAVSPAAVAMAARVGARIVITVYGAGT